MAMYLSLPSGRLPRCVCVNAAGAISSDPAFGTIARGLGLGAIVVAGLAFGSAFLWWRQTHDTGR